MSERPLSRRARLVAMVLGLMPVASVAARADDPPAAAPVTIANPSAWAGTIRLGAQVEGGISFDPEGSKTNFGQLLTDKPNTVELNQILVTAQRTIDPKNTDWDVGFKLQASTARTRATSTTSASSPGSPATSATSSRCWRRASPSTLRC